MENNNSVQQLAESEVSDKILREKFLTVLKNLLIENESDFLAVTDGKLSELRQKYNIKDTDVLNERKELYDIYLNKYLYDEKLTDKEKKNLEHLKKILKLSDEYTEERIKHETELVYRRKVKAVVSDSKINWSEKKELEEMKENLNIGDSEEGDIRINEIHNKIQSFVDDLIAKRRISPNDEMLLNQYARGMHVRFISNNNGLNKLKLFWRIENMKLPVIKCNLNLQNLEELYYKIHIAWYEVKADNANADYEDLFNHVKICKGDYIQADSIAPSYHIDEYMEIADSGELYITNQRILFIGNNGNKIIELSDISFYTPYNNGLKIYRNSGNAPFFECDDPELLGMYISKVIADL